jgi:phage terminase large subunit GpA-like protein
MTVRAIKPDYFETDIQQNGVPPADASGVKLESQQLFQRMNGIPRGTVPDQSSYLTAFIDSSDEVLWWMVTAWQNDFTGWVVDYGTWPDQVRPTFQKRDLAHKISQQLPGHSWEEAFVHAHNQLELELLEVDWFTETGQTRKVDLILKDWADGQHKPRIMSQVMNSMNRAIIRPSKGAAQKPGRKPIHLWGDPNIDRDTGEHWVERRDSNPIHVQYDTNIWKTHAARRLITIQGAASAVTLPGENPNSHSKLVDHFTAETPKSVTVDGSSGTMWQQPPGVENDWWDCFVGTVVGASMLGCQLKGEQAKIVEEPRVFSLPGA